MFAEPIDEAHHLDAVESKLFGIGAEAYTVGSFEFYLGYAIKNQKADVSGRRAFPPDGNHRGQDQQRADVTRRGCLLHVSRGVRWDSDHVIVLDDALRATMEEIVRGEFPRPRRTSAWISSTRTINRVAAWTIGMRNALKALLLALLEPTDQLRAVENAKDYTSRLALMEERKLAALRRGVGDEYCRRQEVPVGAEWLRELKTYEKDVLSGTVREAFLASLRYGDGER